ncbi:MAG: MdtA/MuxA family multidrug efflux RND transporter periplasmic adaptor subunit [Burkholderiaceae bacterium]
MAEINNKDNALAPLPPRRRWVWLVLLAAVLGAGYWFFWRPASAPPDSVPAAAGFRGMAPAPVPVRTVAAAQEPIERVFDAVGTVTAFETVTVRSRVDGQLQAVYFTDGAAVQAGDVLALVDPRPFQVRLDQANGQLAQTQAQLNNARQDLARFQTLFRQSSIARQQVDSQLALVAQLQAQVQADQAAVDEAALQLSFTRIQAPIDGRLGLGKVDAGNMIASGDTEGLVVITRTRPISVRFSLPQSQLQAVLAQRKADASLRVELYGRDDRQRLASGVLVAIDNQIDVATGTVALQADFPNEDESLFPNQFVNVRLFVDRRDSVVIPQVAVQHGSVGAFVYVLNSDSTVSLRKVVTGWVQDERVAIVSGLEPGDRVVVEGADRLRDGAKARDVNAAPGKG